MSRQTENAGVWIIAIKEEPDDEEPAAINPEALVPIILGRQPNQEMGGRPETSTCDTLTLSTVCKREAEEPMEDGGTEKCFKAGFSSNVQKQLQQLQGTTAASNDLSPEKECDVDTFASLRETPDKKGEDVDSHPEDDGWIDGESCKQTELKELVDGENSQTRQGTTQVGLEGNYMHLGAETRNEVEGNSSSGSYKCYLCDATFSQESCLEKHLHVHTEEHFRQERSLESSDEVKRVQCLVCTKTLSRSSLKKHMMIHAGLRPYECSVCGKKFHKISGLKAHVRIHTGEQPYPCPVCEKRFTQKSHVKSHMKIHTGEKPYQCSVCEFRCSQNGTLQVHLMIHTGEQPFKCSFCQKRFRKKSHMKRHMNTHAKEKIQFPFQRSVWEDEHKIDPTRSSRLSARGEMTFGDVNSSSREGHLQCPVCDKSYLQRNLKAHMRTHTGERPFSCVICQKRFRNSNSRNKHTRTAHTSERPYECSICEKRFQLGTCLKRHIRTHAEQPIKCYVCSQEFELKIGLDAHMKTHTQELPYQCDVCEKRFRKKCNLQRHERTHTGNKPYQCSVCDKRFHDTSNLKSHILVHTGEKPYQCSVCDKRFTQSTHMKTHMRSHISASV